MLKKNKRPVCHPTVTPWWRETWPYFYADKKPANRPRENPPVTTRSSNIYFR